MVDGVLRLLGPRFGSIYAKNGRPSIPPEQLLRALLLQVVYAVRGERMLMERLDYNSFFAAVLDQVASARAAFRPALHRRRELDRALGGAQKLATQRPS